MKKQKTPRKKRVRWLDQIQAEASRPQASYTPPPTDDAGIMKFINQEAAKQRRAQVNRMAGVAFGQQALRSYPRPKRNNADAPVVIRPCARRNPPNQNLPDPDGTGTGLSQHCPASVFSSQTIDL